MSTTPSGRRSSKKAAPSKNGFKLPKGLNTRLLVVLSVVVFAGIPFALGKYFELKCPDPFDSGSYVYSAQHVLSGARIGYEEKPSAQAGTLLVNMLGVKLTGFNETGSKVLQGLFQAAALTLMFITVRRLYGTLAAVISVTVASIYLSAPVIAKFGNVKEQFMIALMILGICCFVWYRLTGRWWWALLTGALLISGPLFKQTGVSAIAAVGLFLLAQPILHRYAWKKVGKDILLLVAGAIITLTPICAWYASMGTPLYYWPYSFALGPVFKLAGADLKYVADTGQTQQEPVAQTEEAQKGDDSIVLRLLPGYVSDSWKMLDAAERKEALRRVLRYYRVLILPIVLALGAILARVVVLQRGKRPKPKTPIQEDSGRLVLLFAIWWFFDMAFVFISPHSYEQYYLPLNASSAVLGGYLVGLYARRFHADRDTARWIVLGLLGLILMLTLSWHIFFGITKSPHTGAVYRDPQAQQPIRTRGYLQKWQEIAQNPQYPWVQVGDYIRQNSEPTDTIYVWGWVPGIYVQAQRMTSAPKAFESMMHTLPPPQLAERVREIVGAFEKSPPKFIVDTRKTHFPWTRRPLELWPRMKEGFVPPQEEMMKQYDQMYGQWLKEQYDAAEAQRYEAMQPFRSYVMKNYQIVREYREEVLFRRK
jgi:4-amino-4-deoxy-L-arabinose transferase-like glycosyltransferase